jgi:hypothetical protein
MTDKPAEAALHSRAVLRLVAIYAVVLVAVLATVSYVVWDLKENKIILWVPVAIWEWSFAGGMVAVLYRLGSPRLEKPAGPALYSWAISTPLAGLFFGAIVYFVALAGARLFDASPGAPETAGDALAASSALAEATWLNVIAFFGGFRADLAMRWVRSFVGSRVGDDREEEEGP